MIAQGAVNGMFEQHAIQLEEGPVRSGDGLSHDGPVAQTLLLQEFKQSSVSFLHAEIIDGRGHDVVDNDIGIA